MMKRKHLIFAFSLLLATGAGVIAWHYLTRESFNELHDRIWADDRPLPAFAFEQELERAYKLIGQKSDQDPQKSADICYAIAMNAYRRKDYPQAIELFQQTIAITQNAGMSGSMITAAHSLCVTYLASLQPKEAAAVADIILQTSADLRQYWGEAYNKKFPLDYELDSFKAKIYFCFQQQKSQEAEEWADKGIEFLRSYQSLVAEKKVDLSMHYSNPSAELQKRQNIMSGLKARALQKQGKLEEAEKLYRSTSTQATTFQQNDLKDLMKNFLTELTQAADSGK